MTTREIFQENLKHYIEMTAKTKKQISEEMGIPYTTLMDWVNGNKFPRADGIEKLANYFKILKSDLLEEKQVDNQKKQFLDRLMKSAYCLSGGQIELLTQMAENMSGNTENDKK